MKRSVVLLWLSLAFLVAFPLSISQAVFAACSGYCADKSPKGSYNGCAVFYDSNDNICEVDCYYLDNSGSRPTITVISNGSCSPFNGKGPGVVLE